MANENPPFDINAVWNERQHGSPRFVQISCIEDFIKITTRVSTSIFRGQRCDWPLVPAVGREDKRKAWFYGERQHFEEFKREAIPHLSFLPKNDWQWLAVAQHNRLPTRLLDWSTNPLIALWFAVSEPACSGKAGIVWAYSYQREEVYDAITKRRLKPFSLDRTWIYFPEYIFPHIQAQAGVFTVHHRNPGDNRFVPLEEMGGADLLLRRIEIPPECFRDLRYKLWQLGIHPASLFPGLSGLVARIRYENEMLEDEPGGFF